MQDLGIFLFLFPICLDFKSQAHGSSIFQVISTAISLVGTVLVLLPNTGKSSAYRVWPINFECITILMVLLLSVFSQFVNQNPVKEAGRVFVLFLLFGTSVLIVRKLATGGYDMKRFLNFLVCACVVAMLWRFGQGITVLRAGLSEARNSIVSPVLPFVLACGLSRLLFIGMKDPIGLGCTLLALGVAILSVTRSYMIAIIAILAGLTFVVIQQMRVNPQSRAILLKKYVGRILSGIILISVILAAVIVIRPNTLEVWNRRLHQKQVMGSSSDITYLTRAAENQGMMDRMTDTSSYLFGKGLGAYYRWSKNYWSRIMPFLGTVYFIYPVNVASHNFWYYMLFSLGIPGLGLTAILLVFPVIVGAQNSLVYARTTQAAIHEIIPFIGAIGFISLSYTSNPIGERFGALVFGSTLALACLRRQKQIAKNKSMRHILPARSQMH